MLSLQAISCLLQPLYGSRQGCRQRLGQARLLQLLQQGAAEGVLG
jgi:hypothetical protein